MVLNGPGAAQERRCQWSLMGPMLILREATDGVEWAQCCSQEATDGVEWAQCCSQGKLPIVLNGPSAANKRGC
jgi:hypothetical protein